MRNSKTNARTPWLCPPTSLSASGRRSVARRIGGGGVALALVGLLSACGGGARDASSGARAPADVGTATLTGAGPSSRVARVLVADKDAMAMVVRGGCVATIGAGADEGGSYDEMRVRCPKPERGASWFSSIDRLVATLPTKLVDDEADDARVPLPAAEVATSSGAVYRVDKPSDAARLVSEVKALAAELAAGETPRPGPASPSGWQMIRLAGRAHVFLGGEPMTGTLDVRMSTTGQYLCEFRATAEDGPLRATKGGWVEQRAAVKAIDDVLTPFESGAQDSPSTFASAVAQDGERRANPASTAAVFARFGAVQKVLGDACLPELEAPKTDSSL